MVGMAEFRKKEMTHFLCNWILSPVSITEFGFPPVKPGSFFLTGLCLQLWGSCQTAPPHLLRAAEQISLEQWQLTADLGSKEQKCVGWWSQVGPRPACQLARVSVIEQNESFVYFLAIAKLEQQRVQLCIECCPSMNKALVPPQHFFVFVFFGRTCASWIGRMTLNSWSFCFISMCWDITVADP